MHDLYRRAEKLGVSEPHVTNRLRLLKLPAKWQKRILSRELPPTHARSLATYAEYPEILKQVEDQVFGQWTDGAPVSLKKFDELLGEAVDEATQELTGNVYSHNCHGSAITVTPCDPGHVTPFKPLKGYPASSPQATILPTTGAWSEGS